MPPTSRSSVLFLFLVLICRTALASDPAGVLLWAHRDQKEGSTDSAGALKDSLKALGVETLLAEDLLAQDLGGFKAVFAVLGTFPRRHRLSEAEADALTAYLRDRQGALYMEGGDAWYDMPAALRSFLGISLDSDGVGDLSFLEGAGGVPGPELGGLRLAYNGENRSLDRLLPEGEGARVLWRNAGNGAVAGVFRKAPGPWRTIGVTFEFGGLPLERTAVLAWYLDALGVTGPRGPSVETLSAVVALSTVSLSWKSLGTARTVIVERDGALAWSLSGDTALFEDRPGPGEHLYRVTAAGEGTEGLPSFVSCAVLQGAHVIWQPPETLPASCNSAREIQTALQANSRGTVTVTRLDGLDLTAIQGLWAVLGVQPIRHRFTAEEGQLLADYLAGTAGPAHPRLYIEGGDLWGRDKPTALRALDGVVPVTDGGSKKLLHVRGLDTGSGFNLGSLVRLPVDYTGDTDSIDILSVDPQAAGAGAAWIDDDTGDVIGIFRRDPGGRWAMLSASFQFGGITGTRPERALLMDLYLTALEPPATRFRRGDVDGSGETTLTDAVQLLEYLFLAGRLVQDCADAADTDDSGELGLTDAVLILAYLFLDGPAPVYPGPAGCGPDLTEDGLPECHPSDSTCR